MSQGPTKTCSGVVERGSVEPRGYAVDAVRRIFQVSPNYLFGYEPIEAAGTGSFSSLRYRSGCVGHPWHFDWELSD